MSYTKADLDGLNKQLEGASAQEIIKFFVNYYKSKVTFGTSLGAEDQVIYYMLSQMETEIPVFTLDTGRVFPEVYDLISTSTKKYKLPIRTMFPDPKEVEVMVDEKGVNLFFDSVENRKQCCQVRKLNPLARALVGKEAWFTGLRKSQSVTRKDMQVVEWDKGSNCIKVNPLIHWSEQDVWNFINENHIPYNPMHKKGYPSIGCQPCTRAILEGEDIRAGRWWWEDPESKECGLHK